jgi:phosphoribosylanthranilate isomerase
MNVFVKICGIRDAEMAAAAVDAGANAIGFVFAESVRRVTVAEATDAARDLPSDIKRVAVMKHPSSEEWQEVLEGFSPDALQTDIVDFAELDVPPHVQSWPVYREGGRIPAEELPYVFVYEGASSGVGQTVDWNKARQVARKGRMILAGGLDAGNVAAAIRDAEPWGVDVSSGVEAQPGQKDVNKIREFIGVVRAAEKEA